MVEDTHSDDSMEAEEGKVNTQNDPMQNGSNQAIFDDTGIIPNEAVVQENNMEKEMMPDVNVTVTVEERQKSKEEEEEAEKAYRESWDNYEEDEENASIVPYVMVFIILMVGSFMLYVSFSNTATPQDVISKDEESVEEVFVSQKLEEKESEKEVVKESEKEVVKYSSMTKKNQNMMNLLDALKILGEKKDKEAFRDSIKDLTVEELMILESNKTAIEEHSKKFDLNVEKIKVIITEVKKTVLKKETVEGTNTDMGNTESDELEETKSKVEEERVFNAAGEFLKNHLAKLSKFNDHHSKVNQAHEEYEKLHPLTKWTHSFYCDCCYKSEHQKNIEAIHEEHAKTIPEDEDEKYKTLSNNSKRKSDLKFLASKWEWRFGEAIFSLTTSTVAFVYHYEQKQIYCSQAVISSLVSAVVFALWTFFTLYKYKKYTNDEQAIIIGN